jgi:hypothetical protein
MQPHQQGTQHHVVACGPRDAVDLLKLPGVSARRVLGNRRRLWTRCAGLSPGWMSPVGDRPVVHRPGRRDHMLPRVPAPAAVAARQGPRRDLVLQRLEVVPRGGRIDLADAAGYWISQLAGVLVAPVVRS